MAYSHALLAMNFIRNEVSRVIDISCKNVFSRWSISKVVRTRGLFVQDFVLLLIETKCLNVEP